MNKGSQNQNRIRVQQLSGRLLALAGKAGFNPVILDIIQPAEAFIDLSGEDLRHRLCLIDREGGGRQCLRPDFTIPTGLDYVTGLGGGRPEMQKLSYAGPVFRRQADGTPVEIPQVGVESFGDPSREAADVEILSFAMDALSVSGVRNQKVRLGDLGLFAALLDAIEMPARWRQSLCRAIWRPGKFERLLDRISRQSGALDRRDAFFASIGNLPQAEAQAIVAGLIDYGGGARNAALPGGRTVEEITIRLMNKAEDAGAEPLPQDKAALIRNYLTVSGPPKAALAEILSMARDAGLKMDQAIERFAVRLQLLESQGLAVDKAYFSAEFGRSLEYYTGFVFELTDGQGRVLAGGGRYDTLLAQLGLDEAVPAVGCAIKAADVAFPEKGTP